jgi:hypothetical protein
MVSSTARRLFSVVAGLAMLIALTASVSLGQVPDGVVPDGAPPADQTSEGGVPDLTNLDKHPKMDGVVAATARTATLAGDDAALDLAQARGLSTVGSDVRVVVESADPDLSAAREVVLAAGGTVEAEYADLIQALLAPSMLEQVANDPAVRYVRAPASAVPGRSGR